MTHTRTAIMIGDMVVGSGATPAEAWADARRHAVDKDVLASLADARECEYDAHATTVGYYGGIVTLRQRITSCNPKR